MQTINPNIMSDIKFSYKDFYSTKIKDLKLGDALEMHYKLNPQFKKWNEFEDKFEGEVMKSHDLTHIIFGCDTSLTGEMTVELWTLFANDIGFRKYMKLVSNSQINKEPFAILKRVGYHKVIWTLLLNFWRPIYIWFLAFRMKKKWGFLKEEKYMQTTIGQIRKEYNISII